MDRQPTPGRRMLAAGLFLVLVLAATAAGCDAGSASPAGPGPTATPAAASAPASTATPSAPSGAPASTPTAGPVTTPSPAPVVTPADLAVLTRGALAVTVTDDLRVRSEPRVADDSVKHAPTLPAGTQLIVIGGPVEASGFTWIQVSPIGFKLRGDVDAGWVAIAGKDGTPWVGPAKDPTPGYELASVIVERAAPALKDARAAATAQNAFGIALYRRMLRDPSLDLAGKNVVISPYSITTALAMARAGAKGRTATEMDAVLRLPGWDRLGTGLSALDQRLTSRDADWVGYDTDRHWLSLRTANMAFAQVGYPFEPVYLDRLAATFGAGVGSVDYLQRTAEAREAINGWVKRQTLGRIPELLGREDITPDTRVVLVNAVYLKAEWVRQFWPESTRNRSFTTAAGKVIRVPTMTQLGEQAIPLATGDGWKATELMYAGPDGTAPLSMTLILPDSMTAFERSLSPRLLATIQARLAAETRRQQKVTNPSGQPEDCGEYAYQVQLRLPKFGTDTRAKLPDSLQALGMVQAFDPFLADLSGMTTIDDPLYISAVIHQANIDVDEVGTTAAAATAVGVDTTGGCTGPSPKTTKVLAFNRPFMYLVRDRETGAILFLGRVLDSTAR